jgi:hypothetical protein
MLKKCLLVGMAIILLASIGALTSCNGYPKTPEDVVKEAYLSMSKMDYEGCKRFMAKSAYFPTEEEFRELVENDLDFIQTYQYYEVTDVEIEGGMATVTGNIHYAGGTEPDSVLLVQEDGLWKIYQ